MKVAKGWKRVYREKQNGKNKLKQPPIRETKVSVFFEHVRGMLLHTQRVTRQEAARYDLSIAGVVEELPPPVEDIFSLME